MAAPTTVIQQAPAPAPPAANTDMMQMMMMNNMMQQQNELSHQRAMEREHAHDHDRGAKAAPTVVQVQAPAAPPPIPTGNCCGMELFSGLNCCSICQIVWMVMCIGGLMWYSGWIAYTCSCEPWQPDGDFWWWDMQTKRDYVEGVCYTQIDEEWYNNQADFGDMYPGDGRRQLKASELFPVPGADDVSPARVGVGGLVPVVPKEPAPAVATSEPDSAPVPTNFSARRRTQGANRGCSTGASPRNDYCTSLGNDCCAPGAEWATCSNGYWVENHQPWGDCQYDCCTTQSYEVTYETYDYDVDDGGMDIGDGGQCWGQCWTCEAEGNCHDIPCDEPKVLIVAIYLQVLICICWAVRLPSRPKGPDRPRISDPLCVRRPSAPLRSAPSAPRTPTA